MHCDHVHKLHVHIDRLDPTQTSVLVRAYERDVLRRFRGIRRAIVHAIVTDDVFGLQTETASTAWSVVRRSQAIPYIRVPGRKAFSLVSLPQKVVNFMNWLVREETSLFIMSASTLSEHWQDEYIRSAYQTGMASAARNMTRQGVMVEDTWHNEALFRPRHRDQIKLLSARAVTQLEGLLAAMNTSILRVLGSGLTNNVSPRDLAKSIADRLDAIGIVRARSHVRTEVVNAHAEASLNTYREAGLTEVSALAERIRPKDVGLRVRARDRSDIGKLAEEALQRYENPGLKGVEVLAEFATADDDQVCPKCRALEEQHGASGTPLPIDQASGIIPVHPNCRCAWLPVVVDPDGRMLR